MQRRPREIKDGCECVSDCVRSLNCFLFSNSYCMTFLPKTQRRIDIHTISMIAAIFLIGGCSKHSSDNAASKKAKSPRVQAETPSPEEQMTLQKAETYSPEERKRMADEAKRQALAEFTRHFTNINGCWYASVTNRGGTIQMTNVVPVVRGAFAWERVDGKSRWYGDVVMEAETVRTFSVAKRTWTPWRKLDPEKQLTYTVVNSNGTWSVENAYGDFFTIPRNGATR
ncbi:MAG: hypothetical protein JWM16_4230 [Verrucomicrobiales bacterium]|nr:hypothetical protein [Verrucomicrobiales bacterium]